MNPKDYIRASDGNGEAVRAVIVEDRDVGQTLINVDSVFNWPHKGIATSGDVDADGIMIEETISVFYFTLYGTMISIDEFAPGYYDQGNTTEQLVVIKPTTPWADGVADSVGNTVQLNGDQTISGNKSLTGTLDMSGAVAIYNPVTTEQKVIDMTSAEELRALKPGSYAVYQVDGATNVPGGAGVGGVLQVEKLVMGSISGHFYRFTFSRVSLTPTNNQVWVATCSTNTAVPLVWGQLLQSVGNQSVGGALNVAGDIYSNGVNLMPTSGSNSYGTWVKYPDGTMICWTTQSAATATSVAYGTLYNSNTIWSTFPQEFIAAPFVQATVYFVNRRPWVGLTENNGSTTQAGCRIMGTHADTSGKVSFMAIGRWK